MQLQRHVSDSCHYTIRDKRAKEENKIRDKREREEMVQENRILHLQRVNDWLQEEKDSLTEKNSWMERMMCSLKDDGQSIEIISRMKRGESYQAIAEWLSQNFSSRSDTQILSLTTEHQTGAVFEACSQADSGAEKEVAHPLISAERGTQLDENTGTPTRVGYTNVRILSVSSHS